MTARRIPFVVTEISSEANGHPALLLEKLDPNTAGWQSEPFCAYPLHMELELACRCEIYELQLLCHEFKIPSKVYFKDLKRDPVTGESTGAYGDKLGVFGLATNSRSDYFARELKTVTVTGRATHVKLVFHTCHANKHNMESQIGLIALSLFGEAAIAPSRLQTVNDINGWVTAQQRAAVAKPHSIEIAQAIHEAQAMKQRAIETDDMLMAKDCHVRLQQLAQVANRLNLLDTQKRAAVASEDYEAAQRCKMEIEHLKTLVLPQLPEPAGGFVSLEPASPGMDSTIAASEPVEGTSISPQTQLSSPVEQQPEISPTYNRHEDRPLNIGRGGANMFTEHPPAEGEEAEPSSELEPLNQARSSAGIPVFIKAFGETRTQMLVSRAREWRQTGLRKLVEDLNQNLESNSLTILQGCGAALEQALSERVASVFFCAISLLTAVLDYVATMSTTEVVHAHLDPLIMPMYSSHIFLQVSQALGSAANLLLNRVSDTNVRVAKEAGNALCAMVQCTQTTEMVLNIIERQQIPKVHQQLTARLGFLRTLLSKVGAQHIQLVVDVVLQTARMGLAHPNITTKDTSMDAVVDCLMLVESTNVIFEEKLPNIQPAQRQKIESLFAKRSSEK